MVLSLFTVMVRKIIVRVFNFESRTPTTSQIFINFYKNELRKKSNQKYINKTLKIAYF